MKFAIIETGGKQYKVSEGDALAVEKLPGQYKEGDAVVFDKVLLIEDDGATTVGTPYIEGAKIEAVFKENEKNKKVTVIRFKSKSRYFKKKGHKQPHTKVSIKTVS